MTDEKELIPVEAKKSSGIFMTRKIAEIQEQHSPTGKAVTVSIGGAGVHIGVHDKDGEYHTFVFNYQEITLGVLKHLGYSPDDLPQSNS